MNDTPRAGVLGLTIGVDAMLPRCDSVNDDSARFRGKAVAPGFLRDLKANAVADGS